MKSILILITVLSVIGFTTYKIIVYRAGRHNRKQEKADREAKKQEQDRLKKPFLSSSKLNKMSLAHKVAFYVMATAVVLFIINNRKK